MKLQNDYIAEAIKASVAARTKETANTRMGGDVEVVLGSDAGKKGITQGGSVPVDKYTDAEDWEKWYGGFIGEVMGMKRFLNMGGRELGRYLYENYRTKTDWLLRNAKRVAKHLGDYNMITKINDAIITVEALKNAKK